MQKIAKFEKVSYEQFLKDMKKNILWINEEEIKEIYDSIELPTRATEGSAGYDFKMPFPMTISGGNSYIIPTGIKCKMFPAWVLNIYPRSGLGFKYGMKLENTVGIIDSDYYNSDNEGHIMIKVKCNDCINVKLVAGQGFVQGIFTEYGITQDDDVYAKRNGGFGSTDKQNNK